MEGEEDMEIDYVDGHAPTVTERVMLHTLISQLESSSSTKTGNQFDEQLGKFPTEIVDKFSCVIADPFHVSLM